MTPLQPPYTSAERLKHLKEIEPFLQEEIPRRFHPKSRLDQVAPCTKYQENPGSRGNHLANWRDSVFGDHTLRLTAAEKNPYLFYNEPNKEWKDEPIWAPLRPYYVPRLQMKLGADECFKTLNPAKKDDICFGCEGGALLMREEVPEMRAASQHLRAFLPAVMTFPERIHMLCMPTFHFEGIHTFFHSEYSALLDAMEVVALEYMARVLKHEGFQPDTTKVWLLFHLNPTNSKSHLHMHGLVYWEGPRPDERPWWHREYCVPIHGLDLGTHHYSTFYEVNENIIAALASLPFIELVITSPYSIEHTERLYVSLKAVRAANERGQFITCAIKKEHLLFAGRDLLFHRQDHTWWAWEHLIKYALGERKTLPGHPIGEKIRLELMAISIPFEDESRVKEDVAEWKKRGSR